MEENSLHVELEFSQKYDQKHSQQYLEKHQDGLSRRLSHWREVQMIRRALKQVGNPLSVLDLPCGAGRFIPLLTELPDRQIIAADNSTDMLNITSENQNVDANENIQLLHTSAFNIDLPAESVDAIMCIRLLHHIKEPEHRLCILKEFHRVARESVIFSLWVDGNYKAWKRKRLEEKRARKDKSSNRNRFVIERATIEQEVKTSGFKIIDHQDFIPGYAMWRLYTIRKA